MYLIPSETVLTGGAGHKLAHSKTMLRDDAVVPNRTMLSGAVVFTSPHRGAVPPIPNGKIIQAHNLS